MTSDNAFLPPKIRRLIEAFQMLPGVGQKNAQRLAFFMLDIPKNEALVLSDAIRDVCETNKLCKECMNFCDDELCLLCSSPARDGSILCIVETALDVISIENSHSYKGLYHVLHGALSPQNGIGPRELKTSTLKERITRMQVGEVIIATGLNMEGEATAAYLNNLISDCNIKISRIARGIPTGSVLEHADGSTIAHALTARSAF